MRHHIINLQKTYKANLQLYRYKKRQTNSKKISKIIKFVKTKNSVLIKHRIQLFNNIKSMFCLLIIYIKFSLILKLCQIKT